MKGLKRALVLLVLLASCAVTTIDVDAYKGPLIHNESVRIGRTTVMAVSAKPLLIELRNRLEEEERTRLRAAGRDEGQCSVATFDEVFAEDPEGWSSGYVEAVVAEGQRASVQIMSAQARRVNAVLSLYVDQTGDEETARLLTMIEEAIRQYREGAKGFSHRPEDEQLWESLNCTEAGFMLRRFFDPARKYRFAYEDLGKMSATRKFQELALPANARKLAEEATRDPKKPKAGKQAAAQVSERVVEVSESFLKCRQALSNGIEAGARLLANIGAKEDFEGRAVAVQLTARGLSEIVNNQTLALAEQGNGPESEGARDVVEGWDSMKFHSERSRLEDELIADPVAAAIELLHFHNEARRLGYDYGLSRGPTIHVGAKNDDGYIHFDLAQAAADVNKLAQVLTSGGLDAGRLLSGLERLIDDFIRDADVLHVADPGASTTALPSRERLLRALARFAEKVLMLADNESLLEGAAGGDSNYVEAVRTYSSILQTVGNSILVQLDEIRNKEDYDRRLGQLGLEQVAALKAVMPSSTGEAFYRIDANLGLRSTALQEEKKQQEEKKSKAEEGRDKALTVTDSIKATDGPDLKRIVEERLKAAKAELDALVKKSETSGGLDALIQKIASHPTKTDEVKDLPSELKDDLTKLIQAGALAASDTDDLAKVEPLVADLKTAVAEAGKKVEAREEAVSQLPKKLEAVQDYDKEIEAAEKAIPGLTKRIAEVTAARKGLAQLVEGNWPGENSSLGADGAVVRGALMTTFGLKAEAESDATKKKVWTDGLTALQDASIADFSGIEPELVSDDPRKSLRVLVKSLRAEYLQYVRREGSGTRQAANMREAIQLAEAYLSDAMYIRAPISYLRDATRASSLRNKKGKSNLLWEVGLSVFQDTEDNDLVREIDQQFWQNINRVRVTGSGKTSYVMVKDDIGNWYVKNYETDPEDIIAGAKAMATAGISSKLGVDLFQAEADKEAAKAAAEAGEPLPEGSAPSPPSRLEKQQKGFADKYDADALAHAKELAEKLGGLSAAIEKKWSGDATAKLRIDAVKGALASAVSDPLTDAVDDAKEAAADEVDGRGEKLTDVLRDLRRFGQVLDGNLDALEAPSTEDVDAARDELAVHESAVKSVQEGIAAAEQEIEEAQADEAGHTQVLDELKAALAASDSEDSQAKKEIERRIGETETKLGKAKDRKDAARDKADTKRKELDDKRKLVEEARKKVTEEEAELAKLQKAVPRARELAASTVRSLLTETLTKRTASIDRYANALEVLAESVQD